MSVAILAPPSQHIIPVTDERLNFPNDAEKSHRDKINDYNDLLEDIYHRELELAKLKASLIDMKVEIVEEAETLDTRGNIIDPASLKLGTIRAGEALDADASSSSESESGEESEGGGRRGLSGPVGSGAEDATGVAPLDSRRLLKKKRESKGKSKGKGKDATRTEERGAGWDWNLNVAGGARKGRVADDDE